MARCEALAELRPPEKVLCDPKSKSLAAMGERPQGGERDSSSADWICPHTAPTRHPGGSTVDGCVNDKRTVQ